jgi:hypothetical protein
LRRGAGNLPPKCRNLATEQYKAQVLAIMEFLAVKISPRFGNQAKRPQKFTDRLRACLQKLKFD